MNLKTYTKTRLAAPIIMALLLLFNSDGYSQDPIFSQPFLTPIYFNPAAAGCGQNDLRFSVIGRRQWWSIPSTMNYIAVSADKYLPAIGGGLGVLATHSSEGYLNKNGIYLSYAYHICGGTPEVVENGGDPRWFMTLGLQAGIAQTKTDYKKLIFSDQVNINGYIPGSATSADLPFNNGHGFPDFATGVFFNYNLSNSKLLLGFSAHHINTPDESLTFSGNGFRSQLPVRWNASCTLTGGNYEDNFTYSIAAIGYKQEFNSNIQLGAEATFNKYNFSVGGWYRFNLKDQFSQYKNVNALVATLTIYINRKSTSEVTMGIAQDFETGLKANSRTTSSSEFGAVWDYSTYRQERDNPCKPVITAGSVKCFSPR